MLPGPSTNAATAPIAREQVRPFDSLAHALAGERVGARNDVDAARSAGLDSRPQALDGLGPADDAFSGHVPASLRESLIFDVTGRHPNPRALVQSSAQLAEHGRAQMRAAGDKLPDDAP